MAAAVVGCAEEGEPSSETQADTGSSGADDSATSPTSVDESTGSASTTTATGESTGAEGTTDGGSTSEGSDGSGSSDTGAALPDCMAIPDMAACEAEPACVWSLDFGPACVVNCLLIEDEATCEPLEECFWFQDHCEFELLK
jgi:hypothetical protein